MHGLLGFKAGVIMYSGAALLSLPMACSSSTPTSTIDGAGANSNSAGNGSMDDPAAHCTGKYCDGDCWTQSDLPRYGCGAAGCTPCPSVAHAVARCVDGVCSNACAKGYSDCDGDPTNGCESELTDTMNCGACGKICTAKNAKTTSCSTGECVIRACQDGFYDQDADSANGCELPAADLCKSGVGANLPCPADASSYRPSAYCSAGNECYWCAGSNDSPTTKAWTLKNLENCWTTTDKECADYTISGYRGADCETVGATCLYSFGGVSQSRLICEKDAGSAKTVWAQWNCRDLENSSNKCP